MLSLALDPQAVASAWERVGASIFSDPNAELEGLTGIKLDLSLEEAFLRTNQTCSNNGISLQQEPFHDHPASMKYMDCGTDASDPIHSWNSMMPINLSGACSGQTVGAQQPATSASDGSNIMRVPDCVATSSSSRQADGPIAEEPAAAAGSSPACTDCSDAKLYPAGTTQPQLSRANSLLAVVPDAPASPGGPAHSNSSDSSCADHGVPMATPTSSPTVTGAVPAAAAAVATSSEGSEPLSPRAAMAAAAAAATAAMQKRLMEQQILGKPLVMPGIHATVSSATTTASLQQLQPQPQLQQVSSAAQQGGPITTTAVAVQPAAHSAISAANNKRSYNTMINSWGKPVAAAAVPPARSSSGLAATAVTAAGGELFVRTRAEALARYRVKRASRSHVKKIRYHLRKVNADKRPRIKGRFVSKDEMEKLGLLIPELDEKPFVEASTSKHASAQKAEAAEQLDAAAAAAAGFGGAFAWEEQMQQMHLMGADMAADLLMKFEDADHHMQLPTAAVAAEIAASAVTCGSAVDPPAPEQPMWKQQLDHELHFPAAADLSAAGDQHDELPGFAMGLDEVEPLHFGEDYLNDEASDISHGHQDMLRL